MESLSLWFIKKERFIHINIRKLILDNKMEFIPTIPTLREIVRIRIKELEKPTLYEKLRAVEREYETPFSLCPIINLLSQGPDRSEQETISLIKTKQKVIIESYKSKPIIKDLIDEKRRVSEIISPIENRVDELVNKYEKKLISKFRVDEIFETDECKRVVQDLDDVLNVKKHYEDGIIFDNRISKLLDTKEISGIITNSALFGLLPAAIGAYITKYLVLGHPEPFTEVKFYHYITNATYGFMVGFLPWFGTNCIVDGVIRIHGVDTKLKYPTENLKKEAEYLQMSIRKYAQPT